VQRGLLGPREPARIWDRHLLNSAAMAPLIPAGATVVDLGSGAGLPGIPLLLARPDLNMTLVEPMRRRAEFLRECVQQLDLRCVVVERPAQELRLSADVVVARAVAGLARLVELAEPIAAGRGALLALKGRSAAQELAAAGLGGAAQAELVQIGAGPWAVNVIRVTWARRGRQTGGRPRARRGRSE
jgi:16S rRNA (guanine527-N7)-methyltransferase